MRKGHSMSITEPKKTHISAKIISYEITTNPSMLGSNYVTYTVAIYTYYKTWQIRKRYSNFVDFHNSLLEKVDNLPRIPPKKLFSLNEETIKERKVMFEDYLNFLFKNVNVCLVTEILEFIEMEKELLSLLMKNNSMIESSSSMAITRYFLRKSGIEEDNGKKARSVDDSNLKANYYHSFLDYKLAESSQTEKSVHMLVIEEFLRNLEFKSENKYDIVKTFEEFLKGKQQWPKFKREEIYKLFNGDYFQSGASLGSLSSENSSVGSNTKTYFKGLMYHIGNIEQNSLGAECCLEFLGKLIDYEFNPDCEVYIQILKSSKIDYLMSMKLNEHIKSKKNNLKNTCYRILRVALSEDKAVQSKLKKLLFDKDTSDRFLIWMDQNW